jgi:SAM-dependent methyltransferase
MSETSHLSKLENVTLGQVDPLGFEGATGTESTEPLTNFERPPSPAPSLYSITSSLRENAFIHCFGRQINSQSDVYQLPADDEEVTRLDLQHRIFKADSRGKNYFGPVAELLAPRPGNEQPAILYLGCGSGTWIIEMAQEFPHCTVLGIDLAPTCDGNLPPNCRIEIDDINLGMTHYRNCFDLVHARSINTGIKDYYRLIEDIAVMLRPGGICILEEANLRALNENRRVIYPQRLTDPHYSYFAVFFHHVGKAVRARMGHLDSAPLLYGWLQEHHAFNQVEAHPRWFRIGPWFNPPQNEEEEINNWIGRALVINTKAFFFATRPLLLGTGMPLEELENLEYNLIRELDGNLPMKMQLKIDCVWARKAMPRATA